MPSPEPSVPRKPRPLNQFAAFVVVGLAAAIVHYGALIGLVELAGWRAVPATLCGYVGGGIVSYALNRSMTFASARPHQEATWRFALVAGVGFLITWALMSLATGPLALPYLPAQIAVTGIVLFWSFTANRLWTFAKAA